MTTSPLNQFKVTKWRRQNEEFMIQEQVAGDIQLPSGKHLKVIVHSREGFTAKEAEKHETAAKMLEEIVNSVEFKQRFLAKKYTTLPKGKTKEMVYKQIMVGSETLDKSEDYEIDIWVTMYHENNTVVGYTYPSTKRTWLNRKFFSSYNYAGVATNMFHEWLHKVGLDHASAKDHTSVPYAAGYLVGDMVKEMMNGKKFTPIHSVSEPVKPTPTPKPAEPETPTPSEVITGKVLVCRRVWWTLWLKKSCKYE